MLKTTKLTKLTKLTQTSNIYDYLIVGAGIAGLYTAYNLNKTYPNAKICIIESSKRIGGRLYTIIQDGVPINAGGSRFNAKQHRFISLCKELGLFQKAVKISNKPTKYIHIPRTDIYLETIFPTIDDFIKYIKIYIKKHNISHKTLINTTILDFASLYIEKEYPDIKQYITDIYPYYSELGILNAVEGINLFSNEFSSNMDYFVLHGGLEQITDVMFYRINKKHTNTKVNINFIINTNTSLKSISYDDKSKIYCTHTNTENKYLFTKNLILAIPKSSLLKIKYLTSHPHIYTSLESIQCEPLYRIYARYPNNINTGKVWFASMSNISSNLPIKYIIPINEEKGIIMISYTDSKYAKYWRKQVKNGTFTSKLEKQLKQLFPYIEIPKALWYKHFYWNEGAGYWKPGYDSNKIMKSLIKPLHNERLFICGENYSSHQAWCEGALETSEMVLKHIYKLNSNNKIKTLKH